MREAAADILNRAHEAKPDARITGITVLSYDRAAQGT